MTTDTQKQSCDKLKRLELRNFQCHRVLKVELDPTVTAVVGPSDTGKSAILRALRWVVTNRPTGTMFVRRGAKDCGVRVVLGDGEVVRFRSGAVNGYKVDGKKLKAIGTSVPSDVSSKLNISELSFASQHDAPFWFSLSPGAVAQEIDKLVDLEIIARTQKNVAKVLREARSRLSYVQEQKEEAEKRVNELKPWKRTDVLLRDIEDLANRLTAVHSKARDLQQLCEELGQLDEDVEKKGKHARALAKAVALMERIFEKVRETSREADELERVLEEARKTDRLVEGAREQVEELRSTIAREFGERCPLCGAPVKADSLLE